MKMRVISGVVAAVLLLTILFLTNALCVVAALSVLSVLAARELLWTTGLVTHKRAVAVCCLCAGGVAWWCYFGMPGLWLQAAVVALLAYFFVECLSRHGAWPFSQIAVCFFGALLLPYALCALLRIYLLPEGVWLVLVPMIAAWISDCFALFGGMAFGKHKLAPVVSPKKTVEGAVSGVVGAAAVMLLYAFLVRRLGGPVIAYGAAAIIGAVGAVIGQIGDLSFSVIKRQCKIKDYGKIMPGHGGVLDRFDSVIFTGLAVELLWKVLG